MSDLILNIQPINQIIFKPDTLLITPESQNILTGISTISYRLTQSTLDTSVYQSLNFSDEGEVEVPTQLLVEAVTLSSGTLNSDVFNEFLSAFGLNLVSSTPLNVTDQSIELDVITISSGFTFTPNQLILRPLSQDILLSTSLLYFESVDTTLDNSRYISRNWCMRGSMVAPTALLVQAVNNGVINTSVMNYYLETFNLKLT